MREKEKNNGEYGDGDDYREVEEGWGRGLDKSEIQTITFKLAVPYVPIRTYFAVCPPHRVSS